MTLINDNKKQLTNKNNKLIKNINKRESVKYYNCQKMSYIVKYYRQKKVTSFSKS